MDALMAALVAALLIHPADRTAWLAGTLGPRERPVPVIFGIAIAVALGNALAAAGGAWLAPEMSPNARDLLLALALLAAGVPAFWPPKRPQAGTRLDGFLAGLLGAGVLALGDRTLFVTLALAARATTPALAAIGAVIGALVVIVPAAVAGERGRRAVPLAAIRIATGAVLTLAGTIQAFAALRLI